MKRLLVFLLILAALPISGCKKASVPVISAPTTTSASTTRYTSDTLDIDSLYSHFFGSSATTGSQTLSTDSKTVSVSTVNRTSTTITTTTSTHSSHTASQTQTTTTTISAADKDIRELSVYVSLAHVLGTFSSADELTPEQIAETLLYYGKTVTDLFDPQTELSLDGEVTTVPTETMHTLCRQLFGRTYDFTKVPTVIFDGAVKITVSNSAVTYTQIYGYGKAGGYVYHSHTVSGDIVTVNAQDTHATKACVLTLKQTADGYQLISIV